MALPHGIIRFYLVHFQLYVMFIVASEQMSEFPKYDEICSYLEVTENIFMKFQGRGGLKLP